MRSMALVALLATAMVLAGCSGKSGDPKDDTGGPSPDTDDIKVRKGFGAIAGVVIDPAIRPLAGVTVALDDNRTLVTGEDGQFAFEDVEPGAHLLRFATAMLLPKEVPVAVEQGRIAEVRVTMEFDPSPQPYPLTLKFDGRIEASDLIATYVVDGALEDVTGQDSPLCVCIFNVTAGPDVKAITYEAIWQDSTAYPTGPGDLYWEIYPRNNVTTDTIISGFDVSPIHQYLLRNETWVDGTDADGEFTVRLTGGTEPRYQQEYQLFITLWYNGPGDPGYSALTDVL